jgi:hypothetical protein
MAGQADLEVILAVRLPGRELARALPHLSVAPELERYAPEQLCSTSVAFLARMR